METFVAKPLPFEAPYLITHDADCGCTEPHPWTGATLHDVALYLWGRAVDRHLVWQGECPYRFFTPHIDIVRMLLENCAVSWIRPWLPCTLWVGMQPLVQIGSPEVEVELVRAISIFAWLDYRFAGIPLPNKETP